MISSSEDLLLSICVPTRNRPAFLARMLEALLPQVAATPKGEVEVIVLDNASSPETAAAIEAASSLGPLRSVRHPADIGSAANLLRGPCHLARGAYSWLLGDHNLLRPGALDRVLRRIRARPEIDAFYANFRCASYPEHWPLSGILGGYDGPHAYLGNPGLKDGPVPRWSDLVGPYSAYATQMYAHIVRTSLWRDFWKDRSLLPDYSDGPSTYPHTWMLASAVFDRPSHAIGDPVLTIFNGAQSWNDPILRLAVNFRGTPELFELFSKKGLARERIAELKDFQRGVILPEILAAYARRPGARPWCDLFSNLRVLLGSKQRMDLIPTLLRRFIEARTTFLSRVWIRTGTLAVGIRRHLFNRNRMLRRLRGMCFPGDKPGISS